MLFLKAPPYGVIWNITCKYDNLGAKFNASRIHIGSDDYDLEFWFGQYLHLKISLASCKPSSNAPSFNLLNMSALLPWQKCTRLALRGIINKVHHHVCVLATISEMQLLLSWTTSGILESHTTSLIVLIPCSLPENGLIPEVLQKSHSVPFPTTFMKLSVLVLFTWMIFASSTSGTGLQDFGYALVLTSLLSVAWWRYIKPCWANWPFRQLQNFISSCPSKTS